MTKEKIELGDVVHLKSGSPAMTVTGEGLKGEGDFLCSWFYNEAVYSEFFNSACLEKAVK